MLQYKFKFEVKTTIMQAAQRNLNLAFMHVHGHVVCCYWICYTILYRFVRIGRRLILQTNLFGYRL